MRGTPDDQAGNEASDHPTRGGTLLEAFDRHISDRELEILLHLESPARIPTTTREFANLKQLGLVMLQDRSGLVCLTPLGKAWRRTQERWGAHS